MRSEQTLSLFDNPSKGVILSDCERYRYRLWRIWDESKPFVLFIMLNPSTADSSHDDPTIRRCIGFAKSWEFGGMYVGNLFALRSTNPETLIAEAAVIGADNNHHLDNQHHLGKMSEACEIAICAWGNSPILRRIKPGHEPLKIVNIPLHYIELAKDDTPKHPLYLSGKLGYSSFGIRTPLYFGITTPIHGE